MKPLSRAESKSKYWKEHKPHTTADFIAWAKKQMRRARRRFFQSIDIEEE